MKACRCLPSVLLICLTLMSCGCANSERTTVTESIEKDLDLLKGLDQETVVKYITQTSANVSPETIQEIASLYFKHFDYKISHVEVDKSSGLATADLLIQTLDAKALARDYKKACYLEELQLYASDQGSGDVEPVSLPAEDRYQILRQLLSENSYDTIKSQCTVTLHKSGDTWAINRTYNLENNLSGGFMTWLADANLVSPQEILSIFLDSLSAFDVRQLARVLHIPITDSGNNEEALTLALLNQLRKSFRYEIIDINTSGYLCQADVRITSYDAEAILDDFHKRYDDYLNTSEAVIDGEEVRLIHAWEVLLTCVEENTAVDTTLVTLQLENDGTGWQISDPEDRLGKVLFEQPSQESLPELIAA